MQKNNPLRVVLIGDSTVCAYSTDDIARGWGMFIEEHFKTGTVEVINLAVPGRSTKTFREEGDWQQALAENPDFVLIQFGHNDSHAPENPESTDASTDYRQYLRDYIDEARAQGATPILVTPMVRRTFDAQGKLDDNLIPYANAMKAVAKEKNAALVDLHASSALLVENLGPDDSAVMANKSGDMTHFNEQGARAMASLVMQELPGVEPRLQAMLRTST